MPISPRPPSATKTNSSKAFTGRSSQSSCACCSLMCERARRQENVTGFDGPRVRAVAQNQSSTPVDSFENAGQGRVALCDPDPLAAPECVCEPARANFGEAGPLRPNAKHLHDRVTQAKQDVLRRTQRSADRGQIGRCIGQCCGMIAAIDAEAGNASRRAIWQKRTFQENTGEFCAVEQNVVRPFHAEAGIIAENG